MKLKNKMNSKQRKVFYTCSVILGLLVLLNIVSLTYAWFSSIITGNENVKDSVVESGTLSIKYTNSNEIKGENILPGWSETKTFTVENTGTVEAHYNINWNNLTNEFINKSDLVYSITSDNNGGSLDETVLPDSGNYLNIINNINIKPKTTHTYTLQIKYINKEFDQSKDIGKKIIGKIEVRKPEELVIAEQGAAKDIIDKYSPENTEGLVKLKHSKTDQTPALTEYRYSGSLKNHVIFNEEKWRIIGVFEVDNGTGIFEKRIKLIKDQGIGEFSWSSSELDINNGKGINHWGEAIKTDGSKYEGAAIMRLLNPGYSGVNGSLYYNRSSGTCYKGNNNMTSSCDFTSNGLTDESKKLIANAKWYTSGITTANDKAGFVYIRERDNKDKMIEVEPTIKRVNHWIGRVGLPYASDFGYATSPSCYNNITIEYYNFDLNCSRSNWIANENSFLITPFYEYNNHLRVSLSTKQTSGNYYGATIVSIDASNLFNIKPSVYLRSDVKIKTGDGSYENPYIFSL